MKLVHVLSLLSALFILNCYCLDIFQRNDPDPLSYISYAVDPKFPIKIDGRLDDVAWTQVPWTSDFVDIATKTKPRYATRAKIRHDSNYLYIAAWMEEPNLVATLKQKNSVIYHDNDFEIFINPSGNVHLYQEFEMNAHNTIWNLVMVNPYRDSNNIINPYEIDGIQTAVYLDGTLNDPSDTDCCWSVEIAIPFQKIRTFAETKCPPRSGDIWRINFSRVEWKYTISGGKYIKQPDVPEDNWVWSPQGVVNMHVPERWGFLQFYDSFEASHTLSKHDYDVQSVLYYIYNKQKQYYKENKQYAQTYQQLDISDLSFDASRGATPLSTSIKLVSITLDEDYGYQAAIMSNIAQTSHHIRNDSKQWTQRNFL
ncbi:hypothetical protein AKO1_009546 [Acrasis kona]|uniref:Carbohydrate-binding domain-containing protein n=1 Tax=Acrasis kona TaxID=1008807 RepID=A0AAW2ZLU6_9EUKA